MAAGNHHLGEIVMHYTKERIQGLVDRGTGKELCEDWLELTADNARLQKISEAWQRSAELAEQDNVRLREAAAAVVDAWKRSPCSMALDDTIARLKHIAEIKSPPIDAADGDRADEAHAKEIR